MTKKLIALILAGILVLGAFSGGALAAGGEDDPLISLSYLRQTFLPGLRALMQKLGGSEKHGAQVIELAAGDCFTLGEGQYVTLLEGRASLTGLRGCAVNASKGVECAAGALDAGERLIVCEESEADILAEGDALVLTSPNIQIKKSDLPLNPFDDVSFSAWYCADVLSAVKLGLVNGRTPTKFAPEENVTLAETVKLAACMRQLDREGEITLSNGSGEEWYLPYLIYAYDEELVPMEYLDFDRARFDEPATRLEFVSVFYGALPESDYEALNSIPLGSIPDVDRGDSCAGIIYTLYRAGILTGYTETPGIEPYSFGGETNIRRCEVAAIMNRMLDESSRIEFSIR